MVNVSHVPECKLSAHVRFSIIFQEFFNLVDWAQELLPFIGMQLTRSTLSLQVSYNLITF